MTSPARLLIAVVILLLTLLLRPDAVLADETKRPNILVLIADDMSWAHAGYAGDPAVRTPNMDRLAREGVVFRNAHCVAASCTPSRASLLTGRPIWQLGHGSVLWGTLPTDYAVYPDLLEAAGYRVGMTGKGWSPGDVEAGGRKRNPCGPPIKLEKLLADLPADQPFCYWFGSGNPHRPYKKGSGVAAGIDPAKVRVPAPLPDVPEVRSDLADYLHEIEAFDAEIGQALATLARADRLDDTLIVLTSDNGLPFPRGKATLYELGTHMPLVVRWPAGKVKSGRTVDDFVSLIDLAPTFLEAASVPAPKETVGRSLLPLLTSDRSGRIDPNRDRVYLGNERHANVRADDLGYPRRAVRTADFLYIRNCEPARWPAGDPPKYGDVDPAGGAGGSPTKDFLVNHRDDPRYAPLFDLAFGNRPAEELYDLRTDPAEMNNLAADPKYADAKARLKADLDRHLQATHDPRATGHGDLLDKLPYLSPRRGPKAAE